MIDHKDLPPADEPVAAFSWSLELEPFRVDMLRFASVQLNDPHLAEDAVQEAMIGAMKNAHAFAGKAALKTWIFAILRHKIADILRKRQRLVTASSLQGSDEDEEDLDGLFDARGHWNPDDRPSHWGDPEQSARQQQFWQVFEVCLNHLPPNQSRAFMMREYLGLDSGEICTELGLSLSNLHVLLHRSRLRLQKCLELKWFQPNQPREEYHA